MSASMCMATYLERKVGDLKPKYKCRENRENKSQTIDNKILKSILKLAWSQ